MVDYTTGNEGNHTGGYPVDQIKCMDIANAGLGTVVENDYLDVWCHAIFGLTHLTDQTVIYRAEPPTTVIFRFNGTTLAFSCDMEVAANEEFLQ